MNSKPGPKPTGVTMPHVYNVPVNDEMREYIERGTFEAIQKQRLEGMTGTVSLAEFGRRRIFPRGWRQKLDEWRQTQKNFKPMWAGRKRGRNGAVAKRNP